MIKSKFGDAATIPSIAVLLIVNGIANKVCGILFIVWIGLLIVNATVTLTGNELGDTLISLNADTAFTWWLYSLIVSVVTLVPAVILRAYHN